MANSKSSNRQMSAPIKQEALASAIELDAEKMTRMLSINAMVREEGPWPVPYYSHIMTILGRAYIIVDKLNFDEPLSSALQKHETNVAAVRRTIHLRSQKTSEVIDFNGVTLYNGYSVEVQNSLKFLDFVIEKSRALITDGYKSGLRKLPRAEIDRLLNKFAAENPGEPIADYVAEFFPRAKELAQDGDDIASAGADLPEIAPALWATDKQPADTPPTFIQRHYKPWLGKGLARPDIKRLDPQLYVALANWLRKNDMPADLDLPTLKEKNDRWVERIEVEGRPNMGELPAREASHIRNLLSRRRPQDTKKQ